ncbi:MAG: TonB-dependent receptor, partial [Burkholderiaceae bacterium]
NGFHAPTVPQVKAALQGFGVTGDRYACSPDLLAVATAQGAICQPGASAYDVVAGGNANLQPEKSKQATLGVRYEPSSAWSLGADLWHVQLSDRIGQITEQVVFANPGAFPNAWTSRRDLVTGNNYLAFLVNNQNLGKSFSTGLDLDFTSRVNNGWGQWTTQLTMTYLMREVSQLEKGGAYYSAVGNFAQLGTVSFRTQGRLATSLKSGDWTHTLAANFKSGYRDQETTVNILDAAGTITGTQDIRVHAGAYATFDWQSTWAVASGWTVSAGALNLFNRSPPFVASISGTNRGQQFGYDDRYYDARGRTVYVNVSYKF